MLKHSQGVAFSEAQPPSRCDSALQRNDMDLHNVICVVAVQTFQFLLP